MSRDFCWKLNNTKIEVFVVAFMRHRQLALVVVECNALKRGDWANRVTSWLRRLILGVKTCEDF